MCRSLERRRCRLQLCPELLRDALHGLPSFTLGTRCSVTPDRSSLAAATPAHAAGFDLLLRSGTRRPRFACLFHCQKWFRPREPAEILTSHSMACRTRRNTHAAGDKLGKNSPKTTHKDRSVGEEAWPPRGGVSRHFFEKRMRQLGLLTSWGDGRDC